MPRVNIDYLMEQKLNLESKLLSAELRIEELEKWRRLFLDAVNTPLFVIDKKERLLNVNDSFCSFFQVKKDLLLNQNGKIQSDLKLWNKESLLTCINYGKEVSDCSLFQLNGNSYKLNVILCRSVLNDKVCAFGTVNVEKMYSDLSLNERGARDTCDSLIVDDAVESFFRSAVQQSRTDYQYIMSLLGSLSKVLQDEKSYRALEEVRDHIWVMASVQVNLFNTCATAGMNAKVVLTEVVEGLMLEIKNNSSGKIEYSFVHFVTSTNNVRTLALIMHSILINAARTETNLHMGIYTSENQGVFNMLISAKNDSRVVELTRGMLEGSGTVKLLFKQVNGIVIGGANPDQLLLAFDLTNDEISLSV